MAGSKRSDSNKRSRGARPTLRVLFTCVGRRVELIEAFRKSAKRLGWTLEAHGADATSLSPGLHRVDKAHLVPRIAQGHYARHLLRIVRRYKIQLLIPLNDLELLAIAQAADKFQRSGCLAMISTTDVIRTCRDKMATFELLKSAGIDTPQTWHFDDIIQKKRHKFPYFLKPRTGSAGVGNYIARNLSELDFFGRLGEDCIVQEFVDGTEHTLDVYTGFDGIPRCVVPRKRIEVRTGEVSKAVTVKNAAIMDAGFRVATALGGCRGVVTVQCMVTPRRRIRVIEINPRFGGGAPLSIQAGADFPGWLMMETLGQKPRIRKMGFKNDLGMLRFDESVFLPDVSKVAKRRSLPPRRAGHR